MPNIQYFKKKILIDTASNFKGKDLVKVNSKPVCYKEDSVITLLIGLN